MILSMISYEPLRILLVKKKLNLTDLRNLTGASFSVVSKINKDEYMGLETIDRFCKALNCTIPDIVEYIPDDPQT